MKRVKKNKKPDHKQDISDGSDYDDFPMQATKKGMGKGKKTKKPRTDQSGPEDKPKQPLKNTKGKEKKSIIVETTSDNSEPEEKPKQSVRNAKGKEKKPIKMVTSDNSGSEDTPAQTKKKVNRRKVLKAPQPMVEDSDDSDSGEKSQQTKKKVIRKKATKTPNTEGAGSSDNTVAEDKPVQRKRSVNGKRALKPPEPMEEDSNVSDSDEKPQQTKKRERGKKAIKTPDWEGASSSDNAGIEDKPVLTKRNVNGKKGPKVAEPMEEDSDVSESNKKPTQPKKKGKVVKADKKKPVEEPSDNSDLNEKSSPTLKKDPGKGKKAKKTSGPVEDIDSSEYEAEPEFDLMKHQKDLDRLASIDPDFYQFLEKHDAMLLKFNDHEDALEENEDDDNIYGDDDDVHVPGDLHGDSDESDFEEENAKPLKGKVTLKMVKEWEAELQKDSKIKLSTLTTVVKLFNAAVLRATSEDGTTKGEYKVAGSSVFNAVLNMCVMNLPNAIKKYLGIDQSGKDPKKCKHFVKIKGTLVQYLNDVLQLLSAVTSDNILIIMLKHLHQMSKYVACFTRIAKQAIKKLLPLWSTGEETVRVLAFMCILRITRNQQPVLLVAALKAMFMTFVRNCKFVSPTTWPGINFMRRSLVEMFSLDLDASYPYVFLYVRQLGIHLRNAIVVPKLIHRLAVHNWQFLNSLQLWAELVSQNVQNTKMKSLHFPLVMIISNTIKLGPTPQYYPVRFYLIEILMNMAKNSGLFIPILGFFMDVITKFDINKKPKKSSLKPLDFSCIIRLSKSQMNESGFKDALVDRLYAVLLEFTASISHTMTFPEVCLVLILYLGDLAAKCNAGNSKKLKQLYDKIVENNKHMNKKRPTYTQSMCSATQIKAWEETIRVEGTPLLTYYENWNKIDKIQKRKNVTKNDDLAGVIPLIKRPKISEDAEQLVKINRSEAVTLFPSDSEDEKDFFQNEDVSNKDRPKEKKVKKKELPKKKKNKAKPEIDDTDAADAGDIVQEFSASDW